MKFSTGSCTMKQTVLVSSTQKNEAGAQSFPLRCGVTGLAGWSTGTFLIPVLSARTPFVLPAAALFRLLKKRLGSRVSGDTEQIDLRERGVAVFSSSADGFLPLLFLNRRRNSGGWAHLSFAGGRMLDVVLPQEKRCGYAGHARLSRRQPAGAEFLPRDGGKASSRTRAGLFGRSRESRLLFLARIADRKGERDRKNGLVRLVLSSPELAVRLQMLCLSLGLNTRLSMAAPHTVLEIPPSPAFLRLCESAEMAVVDGTGKVLDTAVVYPTHGPRQREEAITRLSQLVRKHEVEHIAIGNGTASRETEQAAVELIRRLGGGLSYMIVSEAGASVYSASKLAAEEFPEYDVNLRSAVSIARRLQDPLAELVKIDPKAIGVGLYQHDMPQARLGEALDGVVEDCVNAVGVDANTASPSLLQRVSGLTAATARNLVRYREEHGAFTTRKQLLKVPKLGPKAYEQCAGFLRVPESPSILDHTGVHPESYGAAEKLLAACGYTQTDVETGGLEELKTRAEAIGLDRLAEICGAGAPTLADIIRELMKPGRDPRDELPAPILRTDVMELKDLKPGMELQGTVRNVIDFGVFVDIGVHQDGLVHISRLPRRVKHPSELLAVGDVVTVWVVDVEEKRGRIGLTMCRP